MTSPTAIGAPSRSVMRSRRPVTGAVITYRSTTRVTPSPSTVTRSSPRVADTVSTSTGVGRRARARIAAAATTTAAPTTIDREIRMLIPSS
jgi:hypothetical protein